MELNQIDLQAKAGLSETLQTEVDLSVVIPVRDEEPSLKPLYNSLKRTLDGLALSSEVIFVDDGSVDRSLEVLQELALSDPRVLIIKFRRNYGQTAAFAAGFRLACGDVVVTMDADLQNDPSDIPILLDKMSEGYDLVSGWRKNRRDRTLSRKIPSWCANRIINKLIKDTGVRIHDVGCSLKAYKRVIVKNIRLYGDMHRFIPAYAAWLGIKVTEVPVRHHPRSFGESKYGMDRVWSVVLDLITLRFYTGFRTKPFRFFGKIAVAMALSGSLVSVSLLLSQIYIGFGVDFQTFVLMILFSLFGGLQFIVVGLLSEIIMRGFLETQDRQEYVVESVLRHSSLCDSTAEV